MLNVEKAWQALARLAKSDEPVVTAPSTMAAASLRFDVHTQAIGADAWAALYALAERADVAGAMSKLLNCEWQNPSEGHAVIHTALRDSDSAPSHLRSDMSKTYATLETMANAVSAGSWQGSSIRHVLNIGMGGSYWGPKLLTEALANQHQTTVSFDSIASCDPIEIEQRLQTLAPEQTLVVITSKSFTTAETLLTAEIVKTWLGNLDLSQHMFAVTSNTTKAQAFGIPQENILPIWDGVGGRYSIWSPVALSALCALGYAPFTEFLAGAKAIDSHVASVTENENVPLKLALIDIWQQQFLGAQSHAILPYHYALRSLPSYCQQLHMESLGKQPHAGAVVWGGLGLVGQHSYFQCLHQGDKRIPLDIIQVEEVTSDYPQAQAMVKASLEGQCQALLEGNGNEFASSDERFMPGLKPFSLIRLPQLTAFTLGALLAMYEHKVFYEAVMLGINPFNQPGVELGKALTRTRMLT